MFRSFAAVDESTLTIASNTFATWPLTAHRRYHAVLWARPAPWPDSMVSEIAQLTFRHEHGHNLYSRDPLGHGDRPLPEDLQNQVVARVLGWCATVPGKFDDPDPPLFVPSTVTEGIRKW